MSRTLPMEELDSFYADGLIAGEPWVVKSGKEATVYCCKAGPSTASEYLAAKVYRTREHRTFKNDSAYREGRVILKARVRRAVAKKTRFGRLAEHAIWTGQEAESLRTLHRAGVSVPQVHASSGSAILMEFIGDSGQPAPLLAHGEVPASVARALFESLMRDVERMLGANLVHADLSEFNILYWRGQAWIIDVPQAVDARTNPHAREFLERDLGNLCAYFADYGITASAERITRHLWNRYRYGEL